MENKNPRGRPISVDVKNNKDYYAKYYHLSNIDIICECGQHLKSRGLYKHKKSLKHEYLMENLKYKKLIENDKTLGDLI